MAVQKVRFGKRSLESVKPPANGWRYVYDEVTPGLALCVTEKNVRTFYVIRKLHGKTLRYCLGRFPDISVEKARTLAAKAIAMIAEGRDPRAERRERRRKEWTLGELFDSYLRTYATVHKRPGSVEKDRQIYDLHLKRWADRRLSTIRQADVRHLHQSIAPKKKRRGGPYAANRMLALLSKMFNEAVKQDDAPFDGPNPCRGVKRFNEQSRERFLQADELPRFLRALEEDQCAAIRNYYMLALLTGARRANLLSMRWDELHLDRGEWIIPPTKTKSGTQYTVPLAALAVRFSKFAGIW